MKVKVRKVVDKIVEVLNKCVERTVSRASGLEKRLKPGE